MSRAKERGGRAILIVEDSQDLRELLTLVLRADGHRVLACGNADEAFQIVEREDIELVITDINLGATSGLDLITRVRRDLPAPTAPIIAYSAMEAYEGEALQRGALSFLRKPVHRETLRDAISAALRREPLAPSVRVEAGRRSQELRRETLDVAEAVMTRLGPRREELRQRAVWSARWLPSYLGVGAAVIGMVRGGRLHTSASSDPPRFPSDELLDERLPLARDVVEASSSILIPDLSRYGLASNGLRAFVGVPIFAGKTAVGAACLINDRPTSLDAEQLVLLQELGRRATCLLSDGELSCAPAFWSDAGWLTRASLELLISLELQRAQRNGVSLALVVFEAAAGDWRPALEKSVRQRRTAIGCAGADRYFVLLGRERAEAGAMGNDLTAVLRVLLARTGPRGVGLVCFEGHVVGASARLLLEAGEAACTRSVDGREQRIERLRIVQDVPADALRAAMR